MKSNQLNHEDTKLLFEQGISQNKEIRNRLIEGNLGLVYYIAKQFQTDGIEKEDLIQIGTIGLMKAVDTFDINQNFKFATYASKCITNEILMYLRKNHTKISCISIDQPILENEHLTLKDVLCTSDKDLLKEIEAECNRQEVREAISFLSPQEQKIILLHFGFYQDKCYNQSEIAKIVGISQSYVSRVIKRSLEKLKKRIIWIENQDNTYHEIVDILKRQKKLHSLS